MFKDAVIEGGLVLEGKATCHANYMFQNAKINGGLEIDASGFSEGSQMFNLAQFVGGKSLTARDFGRMTTCYRIFSSCTGLGKLKFSEFKFGSAFIAEGAFVSQEFVDESIDVTAVMPVATKCTSLFAGSTFNKTLDSVKIGCECLQAFFTTKGVEEIGTLDLSNAKDATEVFLNSSINVVGRLEVSAGTKARAIFAGSYLDSVMDVNEEFANADTIDIFRKTPAATVYGEDGEYLKLYLKGLKEG